jgi:putative ABC transport system permease protein
MNGWTARAALGAYRRLVRRYPADFRLRYEDEMVAALVALLAVERRRRGRLAAAALWMRAMRDVVVTARSQRPPAARRSVSGWSADWRQGARTLLRDPLFAIVVVLTLALSIGGVTAVFTLADPILFRPLPYPDADRVFRTRVEGTGTFLGFPQFADYFAAKSMRTAQATGAFYAPVPAQLAGGSEEAPATLLGYRVTGGMLDVLGIAPERGRLFVAQEYDAVVPDPSPSVGEEPALITDGLWTRAFGRRDEAIGAVLPLTVRTATLRLRVVGVLRPDFVFPDYTNDAPSFLMPGRLDPAAVSNPRSVTDIFLRLRPGVDSGVATAELQDIARTTEREYAVLPQGRHVTLLPIRDTLFKSVRTPLAMLLAITIAILVLASVNLAHLYLVRTGERTREIAVRCALGASAWRIVRWLMTETLILAIAGGAAALAVGRGLFGLVMSVMPQFARVYRLAPAGVDARVVAATAFLSLATLIVFGVAPALGAARPTIAPTLQEGSSRATGRRRARHRLLTAIQAGLAVSILVVSALIVVSFVKLASSVHGVDFDGVTSVSIDWPASAALPARQHALAKRVTDESAAALRGRLGVARGTPGLTFPTAFWRAEDPDSAPPQGMAYPADRSYLDIVRVSLVRGRLYTDEEAWNNVPVAIIDERAAEVVWPGQDPLGRLIKDRQASDNPPRTVIGVVKRLDVLSTNDWAAKGIAFVPLHPDARSGDVFVWRGTPTVALRDAVAQTVRRLDPSAVVGVRALEPFERTLGEPRLMARLLGVLGALALVLTMFGVYSVVSHTVAGRRVEIGVRMALGASATSVRRLVLRDAVLPAAAGIAVGLVPCLWWTGSIRKLLFALEPHDPIVVAAASGTVLVIVAVAALGPARRASRVDPVVALRQN